MDSSERSKSRNRERMPSGKTGEGSSSALNEMVKRAPRQPEPFQPHAPGSDQPGDAQQRPDVKHQQRNVSGASPLDKGPSAN